MGTWYKGMVKRVKWEWRSLKCQHHFQLIGHHRMVSENLYGCVKCGVYFVHHTGINLGYKTNKINDKEWMVSGK